MIQESSNGSKRMSTVELKRLPSFDFKAGGKETSSVDCAVCLENFKMGDKCRANCRHSFHVRCIDSLLLKTPVCPLCRIDKIVREEK
ncbi:RING-H2 finger protein ATL56 [Morella rubra]|uniref:RING-type E3 ubiquitin transferase n=1 Tax=Morella rubra TaxID=262757 RepID=A0A6A1UNQ4_9ROSI|nr:RING-H2 finger protein ATL56 [Morella rubra]